jgi:hypothetical protein
MVEVQTSEVVALLAPFSLSHNGLRSVSIVESDRALLARSMMLGYVTTETKAFSVL